MISRKVSSFTQRCSGIGGGYIMATSSDIVLYRYSPENMEKSTLEKLFIGRGNLLESLLKELENAAKKKTPRFYLVVGPRGIGKSHLLVLLYYELKDKLGSLLIPVKLAEEEYSVFRASDLFLRILEEQSEDTSEILSLKEEDEILRTVLDKLKEISKKNGKQYVIFIENLHELFRQLETQELQKLRAIFQKYDFFSVVATSPMIFPAISDHEEPFFNFFDLKHLREFSLPEIIELIKKIAEVENNTKFLEEFNRHEPKIHGMAHLTGGSPRLVILLYEMITKGEIENIEKVFLKMIDEHTPYYQEIFQLLPMQRRRIFDILISSGAPVTPKQISEKARIELPTVITQLRRLEKDGYIISRPMGKRTLYEVRERLFRLWREMRQPFGRRRVSILLEFLQLWYTPDEQKELFETKFELLEAGEKKVLRDLCYYAEIMPPEFKAEALLKLTSKLLELGEWEEAKYEIKKLRETVTQTKDKKLETRILLIEGLLLISESRYEDALDAFKRVLGINPQDEPALLGIGLVLRNLDRLSEALEAFEKVLIINPKAEFGLHMKGLTLGDLGKFEEALNSFNEALQTNPKNETVLSLKGAALGSLGRFEEALESFNQVLEINSINEFALSRKGIALQALGKNEEAVKTFNNALEIKPQDEFVLSAKGEALLELGRDEEALETFNKKLEMSPRDEKALLKKGTILAKLGRDEEAIKILDEYLKIKPNYIYAIVRKGALLGRLGNNEGALEAFNNALEINPKNKFAIGGKGLSLFLLNRYEESLEAFGEALKIDPDDEFVLKNFVKASFTLAVNELKTGNRGNATRLTETAYEKGAKLKADKLATLTIAFLKNALSTGEPSVVKAALEEIKTIKGDEYRELLKPVTMAMEIIETKDIQKYYGLQIEEREIVADIVRTITRSDDLVPEEIRKKEGS
jgi:tetratricopeptide (TPR) repeat protein